MPTPGVFIPAEPPPAPKRRSSWPWMAAAIALYATLGCLNSWDRDFWAPEEPDFAAVVKEMTERMQAGDGWAWLFPTIGGERYFEKPPFLYWCALVSSRITGLDPHLAYRLPVAMACALALAATYWAGRRFFSGRVAAAACLIQASSYLQYHAASWFLTDGIFAAAVAVAAVSLGNASLWEPGGRRWTIIGWTALGVAALSKSVLLAPVLALGPVLLLLVLKRGGPGIVREILGLRPLMGLGIFLGMVLPWYIVMSFKYGTEFFSEHIVKQHFLRLADSFSHERPFWYYMQTLATDFLPWSPFLPLAVYYGKTHFRRPGPRFFMLWFAWGFLLLSCVSSKQGKYLLPLWPALSLLVAAGFLDPERESIWEGFLAEGLLKGAVWAMRVPLGVLVACAAFWGLGFHANLGLPEEWMGYLGRGELVVRWILVALVGTGGLYGASYGVRKFLRQADPARAVACLGAAALLSYAAASFAYESLNEFKSARRLCQEVAQASKGHDLAIYGRSRAAVHYYLTRDIVHLRRIDSLERNSEAEKRLDEYINSAERVFILMTAQDWETLQRDFAPYRGRLHTTIEGLRFGFHRAAVLLSNKSG